MISRTAIRPLPLIRSAKRFVIPVVLIGIIGGLLALLLLSSVLPASSVEVRALVVVRESSFPLDEMPAALSAVTKSGIVEDQAADTYNFAISSSELASRSSIVVVRGTPIIQVAGSDASAANAVLYANAVAESLVQVLNRSGVIGTFEIIEPATLDRTEPSPRFPLWPPAVLIGLISAIAALLVAFVVTNPIHSLGDLAGATDAAIVEEVWLDPRPPIAGKVRSAAERLEELGGDYRLIHAGWGRDMTASLEHLLRKLAPAPSAEAGRGDKTVRNVVVVMEGTPMRTVLDVHRTLPALPDALILVHPRLAP